MPIKTAVILAAGRGKRMNPLTAVIPKPMLHIAGRPLLQRVIDMVREAGIHHIIMVVGYLSEQIISYFTGGENWDIDIRYSIQKDPLGTANALKMAKNHLAGEQDFLVCAADTLIAPSHIKRLISAHQQSHATITLCLQKIKLSRTIDTALVRLENDNRVSRIIEKPPLELAPSNIACLPLYILNNEVLNQVEYVKKSGRGEYEIQDAIQATIEMRKRVQGVLIDSRITLSTLQDFFSVNWQFLPKVEHPIRGTVAKGTIVRAPSLVCQGSLVGSGCEVGPYGYLETNVTLEERVYVQNTIILPGTIVKKDSHLVNTVVLPNVVVPTGTQLGQQEKNTIVYFPDTVSTR